MDGIRKKHSLHTSLEISIKFPGKKLSEGLCMPLRGNILLCKNPQKINTCSKSTVEILEECVICSKLTTTIVER